MKYNSLQIENKKIINSRAFNTPAHSEERKKVETLEMKLKEAYLLIDNLSKEQNRSSPDALLRQ